MISLQRKNVHFAYHFVNTLSCAHEEKDNLSLRIRNENTENES